MGETTGAFLSAKPGCLGTRAAAMARCIVRGDATMRRSRVRIAWGAERGRVGVALRLDLIEIVARTLRLMMGSRRSGKPAIA